MTPAERQLIADLFDRLATLEDAQRDPEAERAIQDGLRQAPNAVYALVQTALVQDEALKRANARIQQLEAELGTAASRGARAAFSTPCATRFRPARRPQRLGAERRPDGRAGGFQPGAQPMPGRPAADAGGPQPQPQGGGGGSFLGTAAAAARRRHRRLAADRRHPRHDGGTGGGRRGGFGLGGAAGSGGGLPWGGGAGGPGGAPAEPAAACPGVAAVDGGGALSAARPALTTSAAQRRQSQSAAAGQGAGRDSGDGGGKRGGDSESHDRAGAESDSGHDDRERRGCLRVDSRGRRLRGRRRLRRRRRRRGRRRLGGDDGGDDGGTSDQ